MEQGSVKNKVNPSDREVFQSCSGFQVTVLLCAGTVISILLHPALFRSFAPMLGLDDD